MTEAYTGQRRLAFRLAAWTAIAALTTGGCSPLATSGVQHSLRFTRPAAEAAKCLARNAEAHSSALVSEVTPLRGGAFDVTVQVKNGVTYAEARIEPAAAGSTGAMTLYVTSSRGNRELIDTLVRGC